MKSYCDYCDPKYYIVYGFCVNCARRCYPPLWEPYGDMSFLDYQDYVSQWNMERPDLILDEMRRQEGQNESSCGEVKCKECKQEAQYSQNWDSYFCRYCNIWIEGKCGDTYPDCYFDCHKRPNKPLKEEDDS